MIFIYLSVIQSVLILILFKLFDRYRIDNWQAITINYIIAFLLGLVLSGKTTGITGLFDKAWLPAALVLGAMFITTFYFFALSSQKTGVALTSVASKMSVIIPVFSGALLYSEQLGIIRLSGIFLILLAFYLTFKKDKAPKFEARYAFLPVVVFFGNGFVDTVMKYSDYHYIKGDLVNFLTMVFLTSFIIGSCITTGRLILKRSRMSLKNLVGGILLGLTNFGSTYFLMKAMGQFESSVVFPVANASIVGISAIAGFYIFKEQLSRINWAGIFLAIIAIIIIANA